MNPNKMTLNECLDWLHINRCPGGYWFDKFTKTAYYKTQVSQDWSKTHPIESTIDAAAAAMPDGWEWSVDNLGGLPNEGRYRAIAWHHDDEKGPSSAIHSDGDTELLARFRLAVACRMAIK